MIKVQKKNFSIEAEIKKINNSFENIGAISSFIGTVRNKSVNKNLISMTLEHYPGMSEKMLEKIEETAKKKWELLGTCIIHRYGELFPGEQIVLVITTSKHRKEAVESCHFIIDWLKTKGPLVEAKQSDIDEELKWKI